MNELQMNQNDGHGDGQPPNKVFGAGLSKGFGSEVCPLA